MSESKKRIKKLSKALRRIKKECERHEHCDECPFAPYGDCEIGCSPPKDWLIEAKIKMFR